jgi:Family of unknown function (DUF5412)
MKAYSWFSLVIVSTGCVGSGACADLFSPCDEVVKLESRSPDDRLVATHYERNCGATADYSTVVMLHERTSSADQEKDVVFVAKGQHALVVEWKSDTQVSIGCPTCDEDDIFRQEREWQDVGIAYPKP